MTKKWQFPPELSFDGQQCVRLSKILGLIVSDDSKWSHNTNEITQRAMLKIWTIRRMKSLGHSADIILEVYFKEKRSIL